MQQIGVVLRCNDAPRGDPDEIVRRVHLRTHFGAPPGFEDAVAWMAIILGVMFMGISFLARALQILPLEDETVPTPDLVAQTARELVRG